MTMYRITFGTRDQSGDFSAYTGDGEQVHEVEATSPRAAIDVVSDDRGHQTASSVDSLGSYRWGCRFDDPNDLALVEEMGGQPVG